MNYEEFLQKFNQEISILSEKLAKDIYAKLKTDMDTFINETDNKLQVTKDTPIDTPIIVWNNEDEIKTAGHFAGISHNNMYMTYKDGRTSYTGYALLTSNWDNASLDVNAKSILNWIPNNGICPNCNSVLVEFENYLWRGPVNPRKMHWELGKTNLNLHDRIKRYLMLE